jgi:putative membrane protein
MSQPQRNDEDSSLLLVLKGVLVGIANIIPGVSGGTFALVLGIYDRLLFALKSIGANTVKASLRLLTGPHLPERRQAFLEEMKRIDLWFLIRLGVGAMVAIFGCSFAVDWLLVNQPALTLAFFVGLILPSIAVPWRMMEKRSPAALVWIVPGIALTVGVALAFSGDHEGSKNPLLVFVSGVAAISAMILPGISGSFVLLVIGQYRNVLGAIQGLQRGAVAGKIDTDAVLYLTMLAVGCVVGLLVFARVLAWVLQKYRAATLAFLIGLVIGSFWVMWPFKDFEAGATVTGRGGEAKTEVRIATAPNRLPRSLGETGGCGAAFVLGLVGALAVERVGRKKQSSAKPAKD